MAFGFAHVFTGLIPSRKTAVVLCSLAAVHVTFAQEVATQPLADQKCSIDLRLAGQMKDIVSNVLLLSMERPEADVQAFLKDAEKKYKNGDELMRAAAQHFKIEEEKMAAEVERFKHINCDHEPFAPGMIVHGGGSGDGEGREAPIELSVFASDVALHVVLHEMGHALVREFDLPVLGNEETMADAFATHYLTTCLPDRATDVLMARTTSLMIEANEVLREAWPVNGEHDNDARRAYQIAALAIAADFEKYDVVAKNVGMTEDDIRKAKDYGTEIHRSWRRTLASLMMPDGVRSNEARVVGGDGMFAAGSAGELMAELESAITRFDWHSQVSIRFAQGDGGASWSRSKRTITVYSQYLQRFVEQGKVAELMEDSAP